MKLIALSLLQSLLAVVGMGMLTEALGGKNIAPRELIAAIFSIPGIVGVALLFCSFVVTSMILTFTKLHVFVPLNTGMVFLITLLYALMVQGEKINVSIVLAMVLIVVGVALASGQR